MAFIQYFSDRQRVFAASCVVLMVFAAIVFFSGKLYAAERLAVSVATANIRSGPGTQGFDILWEVEKYYPIEVIQRQGEWIFFKDFEADEGWIHKDLVDKTDTVVTINDMINVRAAPGTENPIAFKAERGVPLRVLERRGDWLQIESAHGDKGWVHRTLVW